MNPVVIKLGGSRGEDLGDLVSFIEQAGSGQTVIIHGGGPEISSMLDRLGLEAVFEDGLRVTDQATMDVVEMVLAGRVNKRLAGRLQALGIPAVGLSGPDGGTVHARPYKGGALGKVGEVIRVEPKLLRTLLDQGYLPLMSPIGLAEDGSSLNINGDTVASEVATALTARRLIFLTDVPGLLDGEGRCLEQVVPSQVRSMISSGVISGGMIPKLEGALRALSAGVQQVEIRSTVAHGTIVKEAV